jgi:hypothetical protein
MVTDTVLFKAAPKPVHDSPHPSHASASPHVAVEVSGEREFYEIVAIAESGSEHPLAKAIVQHAQRAFNMKNLSSPDHFEVDVHILTSSLSLIF